MEQTTLIIKTLERPACLGRLLTSIRKYYPGVRILVGDDSRDPAAALAACEGFNVHFTHFGHDIGLSAGRNQLVGQVETRYTVLLDDDFVFLPETRLDAWKERLEQAEFDLIGGMAKNHGQDFHFVGSMRLRDRKLHLKYLPSHSQPIHADIVPNFFMTRTDLLREVPWKNELKFAEHHAFFLDCQDFGVRVGYHPLVCCDHLSDRAPGYSPYRDNLRPQEFFKLFCTMYGIDEIVGSVTGTA